MAQALILKFDEPSDKYWEVNDRLGLDRETGAGDWPDGLIYHSGAASDDGLVVFEVWESQEAQAAFMDGRLGQALAESGIQGPPTSVEWFDVLLHQAPQGLPAA